MFDEIQDNRLKSFLQRYISTTQSDKVKQKLKGLVYCGSQAIIMPQEYPAVYVVKNDKTKEVKFTNIATCHSPWSCPHCSPKVMAQRGAKIGAAIDALATWYHEYPMMITFTLPHTEYMSCEETYTILRNTWNRIIRDGKRTTKRNYTLKQTVGESRNKSYDKEYLLTNRTGKRKGESHWQKTGTKNEFDQRAVGTAGEKRKYEFSYGFAKFRYDLQINHTVRVYEFTWGKNSWHPHIHALFWTHEKNWHKIADYEPELLDYWWKYAKAETLKLWNKKHPDKKEENQNRANLLYSNFMKEPNGEHRSVYISKDPNGAIRKISSSMYLCGWGGDAELTGSASLKIAKEGHYTPFQMLEIAYKDATQREKFMKLFIEYATATRGHRRIEFSAHSGIRSIIEKWRMTERYQEIIKKKFMDKAQGKWQLVVWFKEEQWKKICYLDWQTDEEVKATILELARAPDGTELITKYLLSLDIDITQNVYYPEVMFGLERANKIRKSWYAA